MPPKVSIIIPVYNGSNYLKEAIDSALAQTYKNIEIIVINDGSNDKGATDKIAKSYGKKIRYYTKENGGVATALNLGIEKMTGDYFSWLSHDDMYYPEKIEKQITYLSNIKFKNVFLYSNYAILRGNIITPVIHHNEMLKRKTKYALLRGAVNGITVLIPKQIIKDVGLFDEDLRCTQDYDFWRRVMTSGYDFIHLEEVLSITRLHDNQDSAVSPNVIEEGNELWLSMIKDLSNKDRQQLEGTDYNFYYEMVKFLKTTPYDKALKYCKNELKVAENKLISQNFNPKISVIVPFYNRTKMTINSIKSIINQTYNNIEIIIIDDASTDDISELKKYIYGKKNIVYLAQKKNGGPSVARNAGIKIATGEYIAFLDSDDEFVPKKLESQINLMHKHNLNFSHTAYIRRDENNKEEIINKDISGIVVPSLIRGCTIATPTVMIKRSLLIDNNIYFSEAIRIGEDVCFWLEIAKFTEFLFIDKGLTIVNVNSKSHSMDKTKQSIGVQNIMTYLITDDYYSKFRFDISILCNYFYNINQEIIVQNNNKLTSPDFLGYITNTHSFNSDNDLKLEIERLKGELDLLLSSKRWKNTSKVAKIIYGNKSLKYSNRTKRIIKSSDTIENLRIEIKKLIEERNKIINSKRWVYSDRIIKTLHTPKRIIKKLK